MKKQNLKVLLVDPPTKHRLDSSVSNVLDKKRVFRQSLGLLDVAAVAEEVEGVEVAILDCDTEMLNYLQKGIKIEQTIQAFKVCDKAGCDTFAYAMIGIPPRRQKRKYTQLSV